MINNKENMNSRINRMKQLMKYGVNESKAQPYTGVEYTKVAADGKLYGIIREGAKYYIKVSPSTKATLAENFDYIGGFRNRKDNEYTSFANAQKNFDLKMMSINEANKEHVVVESWNPDKKESLTVEATNKMKKEIFRERQIMNNVNLINEKKEQNLSPIYENDKVKKSEDMEDLGTTEKDNIKKEEPKTGEPVGTNGDPFDEKASLKNTEINESEGEVLAWNRENEDYMDKSKGTEIGDGDPFEDKPEHIENNVDECKSMHDSDDQNCPTPGVGEIGDGAPFDGEKGRQIDEAIDDIEDGNDVDVEGDFDDDVEDNFDDVDNEGDFDGEGDFDVDVVDDEPVDDLNDDSDVEVETEIDDDKYEDDIESRLSALEDKLDMIAAAVGADTDNADFDEYTDDDLYDGENDIVDNGEDDVESGDDFADNGENAEGDFGSESDFDVEDDDTEVFESRAYRKMKLQEENRLDDFGRHPAYRKKVMTLPQKDMEEFPGYYDMNDDSAKNDLPYGKKIGSGDPFEVSPKEIENAIVESLMRILKKKR